MRNTTFRRLCLSRNRPAGRAARLLHDRHGAIALLFSLSAIVLFGLAGLAVEGGARYMEKRHGQNAADAAAMAGAIALAFGQSASISGGKATARQGYSSSAVTITTATSTGIGHLTAGATPANATRAMVAWMPTRPWGNRLALRGQWHEGRASPADCDGGMTRC